MSIYGEVLFVENFITGAVILILTGRVCGYKRNPYKIITGAVMCGGYAFVLFVPMSWIAALAGKVVFSAVTVWIVYRPADKRGLLKITGLFYIVSFLMGGVTIAVMYMLKAPFVAANGSMVIKGANYIQVAAGITGTWWLICLLTGMLKEKLYRKNFIMGIEVYIGDKSWNFRGLMDTGNGLKEPVTGNPVVIISKDEGERLVQQVAGEIKTRMCLIPYKTVGGSGLLYGIRVDGLRVGNDIINEVVLAVSNRCFEPWKGIEKYEVLLHQQLLKGEEHK